MGVSPERNQPGYMKLEMNMILLSLGLLNNTLQTTRFITILTF